MSSAIFQLFSTPTWFQGFDLFFDAIILLIALLIAGYSYRVYKLTKENKFFYFSLAFLLASVGLLGKIITYGIVYFEPLRIAADSVVGSAAGIGREYSALWYRAGFFIQMLFSLGAWLLLYFISQKSRARLKRFYEVTQISLFIYLIFLISIVSNFQYVVYYLTSSVILGMTTLHHYKNFMLTRKKGAFLVTLSFLLLTFSHLFFTFVFVATPLYVVGQVLLLIGFLLLLYAYLRSVNR